MSQYAIVDTLYFAKDDDLSGARVMMMMMMSAGPMSEEKSDDSKAPFHDISQQNKAIDLDVIMDQLFETKHGDDEVDDAKPDVAGIHGPVVFSISPHELQQFMSCPFLGVHCLLCMQTLKKYGKPGFMRFVITTRLVPGRTCASLPLILVTMMFCLFKSCRLISSTCFLFCLFHSWMDGWMDGCHLIV